LLEAKRRDLKKSTFSAAKSAQLKTILRRGPSARLLLYDYDNVSSCMDNWATQFEDHYYRRQFGTNPPYTHCVTVPASVALQQGRYTTDLHKFGVPLSYQLIGRYFRGFDLEMKKDTVEAVKGNATRHGGSRELLLVGVSTGDAEPQLPRVNDNRYTKIGR
jgi:hypothetical protein